jgi:hypothetical protein
MLLSNRVGFNKLVYNNYNYEVESENGKLFPQQKFIADFLRLTNPYRGLLIYFGLGTGKTRTAINTCEQAIRKNMKVNTLLPASIAKNYEKELLKYSNLGRHLNNSKTIWYLVNSKDHSIKTRKKTIWIPDFKGDDVLVIKKTTIEQANQSEIKLIQESISIILEDRYNFIKYNGLSEKKSLQIVNDHVFDNSITVIDEAHNFIRNVVNGSKISTNIYQAMLNAKNAKFLLLSGTPVINKPFEIAPLINLVKGGIVQYRIEVINSKKNPMNDIKRFDKYIDVSSFSNNVLAIEFIPHGFEKKNEMIIKSGKARKSHKELIDEIVTRLKSLKYSIGRILSKVYTPLPEKEEEFNSIFVDDKNNELKNSDLFMRRILGSVSYFRRANDNIFPAELPEIIRKIPMSDYQFGKYYEERMKEIKADEIMKRQKKQQNEQTSTYRAFSRSLCNFVFPQNIQRRYPKDIKKMILAEKQKADDIIDGNLKKEVKDEYENQLKNIILELLNIDDIDLLTYSPKFHQMIADLTSVANQKALVYSQFRNIGGIAIFKIILEKLGWIEFSLDIVAGSYSIVDAKNVLSEKYNNKRFIIFNEDRDKTKELMNIFNGHFMFCSNKIQKQLSEANFKISGKNSNGPSFDDNINGSIINTFIITQSGAEGISLTNVRKVLLMEPYWNNVRTEQVIGRAIRTNSHYHLTPEERNVQIFKYIMVASKNTANNDAFKTFKMKDNSLTTDEHVFNLSKQKEKLTSSFLNALKSAAVDCAMNAKVNKVNEGLYKCYAFPINLEKHALTTTSDIANDLKVTQYKNTQHELLIDDAQVVIKKSDNKKYILYKNKLYDYLAYKEAKLLY